MNPFKQKLLTAVSVPDVLTEEQCNMIIGAGRKIGMTRSTVMKKDGSHRMSFTRTCTSCWVPKSPDFTWLYNYVAAVTSQVNDEHYRFDITDMQQLQILRYRPMEFFHWHWDFFDGSDRKITGVINLSPKSSYLRGGLQVKADMVGAEHSSKQGAATFLPAWIEHRARSVLWGERWALVAWITGPAWL